MKTIQLLPFLFLLLNCASLSKEECKLGDWEGIGLSDGQKGVNRLGDHAKACAEYNVKPNTEKYKAGLSKGLETFCTPKNGLQHGMNGGQYSGACPKETEAKFKEKYLLGYKIYEENQRIEKLENEIEELESELDSPATPTEMRAGIRSQIRDKKREIRKATAKLLILKNKAGEDFTGDIIDLF